MNSKTSPRGEVVSRRFIEETTGEVFTVVKEETKKDGHETLVITSGPVPNLVSANTKSGSRRKRFFLVFDEGLDVLSKMLDAKGKVLMAMCRTMGYGNKLQATNAGLADMTGMRKTHVCRAIKELISIGAIEKCAPKPELPDVPAYKVNPRFLFRGTEKARQDDLDRSSARRARLSVIRSNEATDKARTSRAF